MTEPRPRLDTLEKLIALFFGAGLAPVAPGTVGTLAAIPVYLAMSELAPPVYVALTVAIVAAGAFTAGRAARQLGVHDHPAIVVDEVAGFLVTMAFLPSSPVAITLGFVLFRLMDIFKPWPIRWIDRRLGGGAGIMLDDLLAGVAANVVCRVVLSLLPV